MYFNEYKQYLTGFHKAKLSVTIVYQSRLIHTHLENFVLGFALRNLYYIIM